MTDLDLAPAPTAMAPTAMASTATLAPPRHDIPFTRTRICPEAQRAVADVLDSGWITTGEQVLHFEREVADHVGAAHGVAVASCTAAIQLSLSALGLPRGAKVLMSTMTFCGAAGAICHAGLVPVLADIDPRTGMPSPETAAAAAREAGGVDAAVVVHLGGLPTDVAEFAAAAGVPLDRVVEDAAHALGTVVGQTPVGTISRATCFSFYATKNLPIGEGGMVTTDDAQLADRLRVTRLHGMSRDAWRRYLPGGGWRYDVEADGLKANLTDIEAAIGRAQLRHFDEAQAHRARAAARYDARLADVPGIALPARPRSGRHAWHLYAVRVLPDHPLGRDELSERLRERGIGTSVHFIPVHQLSWYRHECILPSGGFPGADEVFEQTLSLPMDQVISDDDVDEVCGALVEMGGQR